jgi:photosystem II stability/assembly factor-like uncharacterized protein
MKQKYILDKLTTFLFYLSILFFLIAFNFQDSKTGGWYQQNMPNLNGIPVTDIFFADSLNGFATTGNDNGIDTSYLLKTTNGGDNWSIILTEKRDFAKAFFFNKDTGFVCGGHGNGAKLYKTTNAGMNWISLNVPGGGLIYFSDMKIFSSDSIWVTEDDPLVGGLYRTTNGGLNWQKLDNGIFGSTYPNKIYFINSRIGFASNSSLLFRTTNSGYNWSQVTNNNGFNDMVFIDSLTGYKTYDSTRKTTDGGITWIAQKRPKLIVENSLYKFALINKDTIWGVGGSILTTLGYRGVLYNTTNGGLNWGYQIPDTINININNYYLIDFLNKSNGWAHHTNNKGIHTTVGGNDTTFFTNIKEQITNISFYFELGQNFPNPFNPVTKIKYFIKNSVSSIQYSEVKLIVYNIVGKEITTLVNNKQTKGDYEVRFDGSNLSSGVYFYTLFVDGNRIDTKKMLMIK